MKKSQFTEEHIAFARRQADLGTPLAEVCRRMCVLEVTYFWWKQNYGGLGHQSCASCGSSGRRTRS